MTLTCTSLLALYWASLAVRRRVNVPAAPNVALVTGAAGVPKVTVPGPATTVQAMVVGPARPSSLTLPLRVRLSEGKVMVWPGPALTTGGWWTGTGLGVKVMVAVPVAVVVPTGVALGLKAAKQKASKTGVCVRSTGALMAHDTSTNGWVTSNEPSALADKVGLRGAVDGAALPCASV